MRSKTAALALALALGTSLTATGAFFVPHEAQAQSRYSYDMFYDELADHGRWVEHPRYGWVWYPTRVRGDWRPYSEGRWVWTDRYGWYWESYEPFGWATYHYGRWGYDDRYGYIWVPGDEWAPAWVSFRHSDDAIGWAPLPPETLAMTLVSLLSGGRSSGYYRYVDLSEDYYRPRWVFMPTRYFNDPRGYSHAYSWRDNDRYYRQTTNVTNYTIVNNYYVNRSIDPRRWESRTGQKIQTVQVREVNDRREWSNDRRGDNTVRVFHPRVEKDDRKAPPERVRAKADDKPVVTVRPELAAPEERRVGKERQDDNNKGRVVAPSTDRTAQPDRPRDDTDRNRNTRENDDKDRVQPGKQVMPDRTSPDRATPATPAQPATPPQKSVQPQQQERTAPPPRAEPKQAPPHERNAIERKGNDRGNDRANEQRAAPPKQAQPSEKAAPQQKRPQQAKQPDDDQQQQGPRR